VAAGAEDLCVCDSAADAQLDGLPRDALLAVAKRLRRMLCETRAADARAATGAERRAPHVRRAAGGRDGRLRRGRRQSARRSVRRKLALVPPTDNCTSVSTEVLSAERIALLDLYASTGGTAVPSSIGT
jgi:hypothetical protein